LLSFTSFNSPATWQSVFLFFVAAGGRVMKKLIQQLLKGDKRAAAQLISLLENDGESSSRILRELRPFGGRAHLVGITGAPGSGKSTLIHGLIGLLRKRNKRVGVIAIDPTSPLTGGALLGDRIRMSGHFRDSGVFIRSMATREGKGGLARAAPGAAAVLDGLGMDVVFIETTGVGQSETAVKKSVHTVVVVLTPGFGDAVQMMKAGVMEIGDIFVVNKGDLKNAAATAHELEDTLSATRRGRGKTPVIVTTASKGKGLDRLLDAIEHTRKSK
jgi:LAO/AO transport system kinase